MTPTFIILTCGGSDEPNMRLMVRHIVAWMPSDTLPGSYIYTTEDPQEVYVTEPADRIDLMVMGLS